MMNPRLLSLIFFTIPFFIFSQTTGDVLPSSMLNSLEEEYPEANFVLLSSDINYFFELEDGKPVGYKVVREVVTCIDNERSYPFGAMFDEFSKIEELAIVNKRGKPVRSTISTASYEHEGIFYDDSQVSWINVDFEEKGSVMVCESKVRYNDLRFITTTYFHESTPIQRKTVTCTIPSWLDLEIKTFHFQDQEIIKKVSSEGDSEVFSFTKNNIAPDETNYTLGPSHYLPHLLMLPKGYRVKGKEHKLFESTADLYAWYRSLLEDMKPDRTAMSQLATDITRGAENDREKAEKIFAWVKENIRYVAFEDGLAGYKPDEPQEVVKKAYGDCKGMACLTAELMKEVGLDARPTWIGTKRIAYDYSIPSLAVDNHMITCLMLDGERIFLDATETYMGFGEYANRIQGRPVLIYNQENYILDTIPEYDHLYNAYEVIKEMEIGENGELKGFSRRVYKGESKNAILAGVRGTRTEDRDESIKRYLANGDRNYQVETLSHSPLDAELPVLVLEHDFKLENAVSSFGDELYINFQTDETFANTEVEEDRITDYVMGSKYHKVVQSKIKIPKGYRLSYSPEPVAERHGDFEMLCDVKREGNEIIFSKTLSVPSGKISPAKIGAFNHAVEKLKAFYKEQIVLTTRD